MSSPPSTPRASSPASPASPASPSSPSSSPGTLRAEAEDNAKFIALLTLDDRASAILFSHLKTPTRSKVAASLETLTLLNLSSCCLTTESFPADLSSSLPSLSTLYLSDNRISALPKCVGSLANLSILAVKGNNLASIPDYSLPHSLKSLILTNNNLTSLPPSIALLSSLKKLMLSHNDISALPDSLATVTSLELVRLSNNKLTAPPLGVLRLPNLKWISLAGNPFLPAAPSLPPSTLPLVTGSALASCAVLGSGSGGSVKLFSPPGSSTPVALKSYSSPSEKLTDGTSSSDIAMTVHVSSLFDHLVTSLVPPVLSHNPTQLTMRRVASSPISLPPNNTTLTRDLHTSGKLTASSADHVATNVGAALRRMHEAGVAHGDVYGHNVLHSPVAGEGEEADTRLSDFGASFYYDKDSVYGGLVQEIEVRAYRLLVSELRSALPLPSTTFDRDILLGLADLENRPAAEFRDLSPRTYPCAPDRFAHSLPSSVRFAAGYLLAFLFTLSFLSVPLLLPLLFLPSLLSPFATRLAATSVLAAVLLSLLLPLNSSHSVVRLGQLLYEPFNYRVTASPGMRKAMIARGEEKKFIFGMHPHGVVPIHALLWAAFCDQYLRDHTTGRTLYGTGAAPDIAMYLPFLRNWLGCLGAGKGASYEALKEGLRTDHLHVLSGGAAEIFEAEPGRCTVVLENRRGLVQLALKTGAELVPCYVFGGDDFFCSLATVDSDSNVLARLCKTLVGNRLPVFWGYLGLPLPFLCTVTACVSAPIPVSKKVGESDAQCIARCHGEYVEAVRGLFEKYKEVSGHGGDVLQVK